MTIWCPDLSESSKASYLAIVDALARDVVAGRVEYGDRLPTHRELARHLGVAIGTVTRAYREAERRGLVRGEVGRGTFVGPSTVAFTPRTTSEGLPQPLLIDLSCNYPLYGADPDLGSALRKLAHKPELQSLLRYQAHAGMWRHRTVGAAWASRFGISAEPRQVLVCNGAQHALSVVMSVVAEPGDTIATESLTYPGMKAVANLLRLRVQPVPMDEHGLIPDALASLCRHRKIRALYVMPTIHNPTTVTLPESRRREIAAIADEFDFAVVEDDVHRLLADDPPPPIATFAPDRSYFIAGVAKSIAGGLRVGFLVAPTRAVEPLSQSIWATSWMSAPLTAEIVTQWIEDGTADAVTQRKRAEIAERHRITRRLLQSATYETAPYAYHIWLHLPDEWSSSSFAIEARRRGVAVTPAEAFAVGPVPNAVRVCISAADDRQQLESGLELLSATMACPSGTCPAVV